MKIGIIGLGKMGNAIAYRLINAGYDVLGFDVNEQIRQDAGVMGVTLLDSVDELSSQAAVIWLMLPAGNITQKVFDELLPQVQAGTVIIDGGNSYYEDSIKCAQKAAAFGVHFLDCGTSGG